jgi:hypothetical protein
MTPDAKTLLHMIREALFKPELFERLTPHREAIAELLEEQELELSEDEQKRLQEDPERLEHLYDFLVPDDAPPKPVETEALRAAMAVVEADQNSIGLAFKNGLCRDLDVMLDVSQYLSKLPAAPPELVEALRARTDVKAAWPRSEPLVNHGLTPSSVYLTCDAPRTLARRKKLRDTLILMSDESFEEGVGHLSFTNVAWEAASLDDGEVQYYLALLNWLHAIQLAENEARKFMFRGFTTVVEGESLRLTPLDGDQPLSLSTEEQWTPLGILVH